PSNAAVSASIATGAPPAARLIAATTLSSRKREYLRSMRSTSSIARVAIASGSRAPPSRSSCSPPIARKARRWSTASERLRHARREPARGERQQTLAAAAEDAPVAALPVEVTAQLDTPAVGERPGQP